MGVCWSAWGGADQNKKCACAVERGKGWRNAELAVLAVALDVHTDSKGRLDGGEKRLVRRRIQQHRGNLLDADLAWVGL